MSSSNNKKSSNKIDKQQKQQNNLNNTSEISNHSLNNTIKNNNNINDINSNINDTTKTTKTTITSLEASTAHDWQYYKRRKNREIKDDKTMSFFWLVEKSVFFNTFNRFQFSYLISNISIKRRAHTITALIIVGAVLVYVALFEKEVHDSSYNTKRYVKYLVKMGVFVFMLISCVLKTKGFICLHCIFLDIWYYTYTRWAIY